MRNFRLNARFKGYLVAGLFGLCLGVLVDVVQIDFVKLQANTDKIAKLGLAFVGLVGALIAAYESNPLLRGRDPVDDDTIRQGYISGSAQGEQEGE